MTISVSRASIPVGCRFPYYRAKGMGPGQYFKSPTDYVIYESPRSVPGEWFHRNDVLAEKFIPEIKDGFYCLRLYHFLGDRGVCILRKSNHPIVNTTTVTQREVIEVHPEIARLTKSMGFEYGKFDYVMHEGQPVLLDANKTPGAANTAAFAAICSEWAKGIQAYL